MVEGGGGGGGGTAECCSPVMMGYGFSFSIKSQGANGDPNTSLGRTGLRMSKGVAADGSTSLISPLQDKTNLRSRDLGSKESNDDESSHYKHDFVGSVLHQVGVAMCGGSSRDFCCTCRHTQTLLKRCQQLAYTGNWALDAVDADTRVVDDRLEGIISAIGCVPIVAQMQWLAHVTCCNTSTTDDNSGGTRYTAHHIAITFPDPVNLFPSDRLAYMNRYYVALSSCPSIASPSASLRPEGADLLDCLLQSYQNSVSMDPFTHRKNGGIADAVDTSNVTLLASFQHCVLSSRQYCHLSSLPSASLLCGVFNQAYLALDELAYCSAQVYDIGNLREIGRFLGDYCSSGGGHIGQNYEGPLLASSSSKADNNDDYDKHGSELNIFLLMCYMICFSGGLQLLTRQFSTYRPVDSLPVILTPTPIRIRTYTRIPPIETRREESYYQLSS